MLYRGRDKKEFYLASLLYDSIEFRHFESVKSLLTEKGADPNIILPKKGISPFHLVVGCDSYEFALKVTSLILQNGGSPNIRSDDGLTPIHIAAAWGRTEILKILLSNGGDPEVRDISYKTPFHYAIEGSFVECLNLLRSYLPEKNELLQKDECDECNLVLDKVLVNNGFVIGEYDVVHENKDSIIQKQDHLHSLPKTDTTEYILNWFNKQCSNERSNITENVAKSFGSSTSPICSDSSLGESDADKEAKRFDSKYITFRKVYRKTRSKSSSKSSTKSKGLHENAIDSKNDTKQMFVDTISTTGSKDFTKFEECSKESGIVTLPSSLKDVGTFNIDDQHSSQKYLTMQEKSSDYLTCSHNSISTFEKNVFEITDDLNSLNLKAKSDDLPIVCVTHEEATSVRSEVEKINDGTEMSFVSVSEVYKYVDKEQGIILYEKRLLKTPSEYARSVKSSVPSSRLSSLPETFDYDTDTLRKELTTLGFNPGPITITTKKVYLRKLHQLKKHPALVMGIEQDAGKKVYSLELEKTLRNYDLCNNAVAFKSLEEVLAQQFSNPDPSRKWREGVIKSSFTYLLLDPRITNNLPYRVDNLQPLETWRTFLSSIFYVGKGKRSRPYQHLYDAVELWKNGQFTTTNKKLQTIIDIWKSECGVICLHVFLNIIPVEAYTREAAMISAIKLENLTNIKPGEFYGVPATWPQRQKRLLGVYLLHKAMMIFLNEGERQLCPRDID